MDLALSGGAAWRSGGGDGVLPAGTGRQWARDTEEGGGLAVGVLDDGCCKVNGCRRSSTTEGTPVALQNLWANEAWQRRSPGVFRRPGVEASRGLALSSLWRLQQKLGARPTLGDTGLKAQGEASSSRSGGGACWRLPDEAERRRRRRGA